jgi:lipopolysaccharide export system protein LptA
MRTMSFKIRQGLALSFVAFGVFYAGHIFAEQADRSKPIDIEANVATVDDKNNRIRTLEGNVILTQGTIRLTAERVVIKEDDAGFITAQIFGGPKGQVAFRQKRDNSADFMEGSADRAEFDDRADSLKLLSNARLKGGGNDLAGEFIYYNSATEKFEARGTLPDAKGAAVSGGNVGRIKMTIQPKNPDEKSKTPAPAKTN